jgi:hypothetical protein
VTEEGQGVEHEFECGSIKASVQFNDDLEPGDRRQNIIQLLKYPSGEMQRGVWHFVDASL